MWTNTSLRIWCRNRVTVRCPLLAWLNQVQRLSKLFWKQCFNVFFSLCWSCAIRLPRQITAVWRSQIADISAAVNSPSALLWVGAHALSVYIGQHLDARARGQSHPIFGPLQELASPVWSDQPARARTGQSPNPRPNPLALSLLSLGAIPFFCLTDAQEIVWSWAPVPVWGLWLNPKNAERGIPKHGSETETAALGFGFLFWFLIQCLIATRYIHTSLPSCFLFLPYISIYITHNLQGLSHFRHFSNSRIGWLPW